MEENIKDKEKYTKTLKLFAEQYRVKENTVRQRIQKGDIYGYIKKDNGEIFFLESARYPYKKPRRLKNTKQQGYHILKATFENKYIDSIILGMNKPDFDTRVKEFIKQGLLQENMSNDPNGLNAYMLTQEAEELCCNHTKEEIEDFIGKLLGTSVEAITKAYIDKVV